MKRLFFTIILFIDLLIFSEVFIPMDITQNDHLKAYGAVYNFLRNVGGKIEWVLNYKGGSFIVPDCIFIREYCKTRKIIYKLIGSEEIAAIKQTVSENNMEIVYLEKAAKIAVFTALTLGKETIMSEEPWDDAVILVLEYAEIPYDKIYIDDILNGKLKDYEWIHLHHEDFTGQYGKFYKSFKTASWYIAHKRWLEIKAKERGFNDVPTLLKKVAVNIAKYASNGGFLFAMCSATDTIDIALSALKTDIVPPEFDYTPIDPDYASRLNFAVSFAFSNFNLITNPNIYEFSDIDVSNYNVPPESGKEDFFLFDFSAKQDPIPTMLCQNHQKLIHGFMGQTSTFNMRTIKDSVVIMGYLKDMKRAKYLYGGYGKGFFTFYGGHDPEDYAHRIGDPPTDVSKYKNSPGYRLILNNILFPAMRKKKMKT